MFKFFKEKNKPEMEKKTKEVTRVINARITIIEKLTDEEFDNLENEEMMAAWLAEKIGADNVEVSKIKDFVMDLKDGE